ADPALAHANRRAALELHFALRHPRKFFRHVNHSYIVRPPSTTSACPVIMPASQARNVTTSAISSVVEARLSGVIFSAASTMSACPSSHREIITPGQTALTRMSGANALASDLVIVIRPPFDAAYAIELPDPATPATDATLTIEPPPPARISGIAARDTK